MAPPTVSAVQPSGVASFTLLDPTSSPTRATSPRGSGGFSASRRSSLAAYMASTKVQLTPSSLAEFLEPGSTHKACVLANSAYASFLNASAKYSMITQVPVRSLFAMADALKAGECQGIIERRMHVRYLESLGGSEGYPVQVQVVWCGRPAT